MADQPLKAKYLQREVTLMQNTVRWVELSSKSWKTIESWAQKQETRHSWMNKEEERGQWVIGQSKRLEMWIWNEIKCNYDVKDM